MQNPIDPQGRKWSLIKITDKVGRQTIQAYRNKWIPGMGIVHAKSLCRQVVGIFSR